MNRDEICRNYNVVSGRIVSPGKFEGQPIYVPYFWEMYLNGFSDGDDGHVLRFKITRDDRKLFPELPSHQRSVRLIEDDNGFVTEV